MRPYGNPFLQRYVPACLAASLVTIFVLFLMNRLIAPVGGDPVVTRMLMRLEIRQGAAAEPSSQVRVFELPPKPQPTMTSDDSPHLDDRPGRPSRTEEENEGDDDRESPRGHSIDWWAQVRTAVRDADNADLDEWLQSQGYRRWVSVMQGQMPVTGYPTTPAEQGEAGSGYRNVYGDWEVPVGNNCVMQIQSRPFDSSNFARNIPPLISCKGSNGFDAAALEAYLDGNSRN